MQVPVKNDLTQETLDKASESLKTATNPNITEDTVAKARQELGLPPSPLAPQSATTELTMPNGSTVKLQDEKPAPLVPSEYQKRLIKQWYEGGNAGPAPFANVNGQLVWVNRKARRTAAKINRKR